MYTDLLTARSPLRALEKSLGGGLGQGNLGLVIAGRGVGKTAFLVDLALDGLLRGGQVLHVSLDDTVSHVRDYYDTVFEELTSITHLQDKERIHADIDRLRNIRSYAQENFGPKKLEAALKIEIEAAAKPDVLILDGFDVEKASSADIKGFCDIAVSRDLEFWISVALGDERISGIPSEVNVHSDLFDVILALEPGPGMVNLRCLKEHDNTDPSDLHIRLDPTSFLIVPE